MEKSLVKTIITPMILLFLCVLGSAPVAGQTTLVSWTFHRLPDDVVADGGIVTNLDKTISTSATNQSGLTYPAGATSNSIACIGWDNGVGTKYWQISFSTAGFTGVAVSSKQQSGVNGPRDFGLQYSTDGISFSQVPGTAIVASIDFASGILSHVSLPSECDNQPNVYLRWVVTSTTAVNEGPVVAEGQSRIDDIVVTGVGPLSDGDGVAALSNDGPTVLNGTSIFEPAHSGQSVKLVISGTPAGTLKHLSVTVPYQWLWSGSLVDIAVSGSANPMNPSLQGVGSFVDPYTILYDVNLGSSDTVTIDITNLTTPNSSDLSPDGNYPFLIKTATDSGSLSTVGTPPVAYVVIPISNLRAQDALGMPLIWSSVVAVKGTVTVPTGVYGTTVLQLYAEDATGGVNLYRFDNPPPAVSINHEIFARGYVLQYYGNTQVNPLTKADIIDNGIGQSPTPITVTVAQLLSNPELYEGKLITVPNLSRTGGTWTSGTSCSMSDGANALNMYLNVSTNIASSGEPPWPRDVTGIWYQKTPTTAPPFVGDPTTYFLAPRTVGDFSATNPDSGLVAYYPFTGNADDSSGNGNNGTIYGATSTEDRFGRPNSALRFNGMSDYVLVPSSTSFPSSAITTAFWFNRLGCGLTGAENYLSKEMSFSTYLYTDSILAAQVWKGSAGVWSWWTTDQKMACDDAWVFYASTYDNATRTVELYLDGSLVKTIHESDSSAILRTSSEPLYIGRNGSASVYYINGALDDIRLYNRVLSPSEIQTLYHEGGWKSSDAAIAFSVDICATAGTVKDTTNIAAIGTSAVDGYDAGSDIPEPPPAPGDYISVYFPHPEWASILGTNYAKDVRANTVLSDTVKRWYFDVLSNVQDTVSLSFVNDRIPEKLGIWLTDLAIGQRVNLRNSYSYKYYNGNETAHHFMLAIGDSTPPAISLIQPNGNEIWQSGTVKMISWHSSDGTGILSTQIESSSDTGTTYSPVTLLAGEQMYDWAVPSAYLNNSYAVRLTMTDSMGNASSVVSGKTFTIVGDSLAQVSSAGWSLVGLPLNPPDSSAVSILGDDFAAMPYYLWAYDQSTGYSIPTLLQPGKGYWLGMTASSSWDVTGTAVEADSVVQSLPIGYTIIAPQYVRSVSKSNLTFMKDGTSYDFAQAVAAGLIVNALYGYQSAGYFSADTMSVFTGYWLGVLQSGISLVQRPAASGATPSASSPKISAPTPSNWQLAINAASSTLADRIAQIGARPDATADFDVAYDVPRPPRTPGNKYLEIYFFHSGPHYPALLGTKYATDFRDAANPAWEFTLESSEAGSVTLRWDNAILTQLAGGVQLILTNLANGASIDMGSQTSYTFDYASPTSFAIASKITGVAQEGTLPKEFALMNNYPNPFNPSTVIRYALPARAHVSLVVYNALGQKVAELVNAEKEAGYYDVHFDATGLASGIYLYRLQAGSFVQTKKLVLMK